MRYVGGSRDEPGCIFCNRLRSADDRASLILHRGRNAFVIMNLFPYNTGHVMIVPNIHAPSPEALDDDTTIEMARLVPRTLNALRGALNPAGFNLGTNIGAHAGAGIAAHLHQHVVPRWQGDANFMPILANTMVLPELIPVTYAKVRAEFARDTADAVTLIAIDSAGSNLLIVTSNGRAALPRVSLTSEPVWRTASSFLAKIGANGVVAGWGGNESTSATGDLTLAFEIESPTPVNAPYRWQSLTDVAGTLAGSDRALLAGAVSL
jgi:ATP adenylyltransferase